MNQYLFTSSKYRINIHCYKQQGPNWAPSDKRQRQRCGVMGSKAWSRHSHTKQTYCHTVHMIATLACFSEIKYLWVSVNLLKMEKFDATVIWGGDGGYRNRRRRSASLIQVILFFFFCVWGKLRVPNYFSLLFQSEGCNNAACAKSCKTQLFWKPDTAEGEGKNSIDVNEQKQL